MIRDITIKNRSPDLAGFVFFNVEQLISSSYLTTKKQPKKDIL
jgi:hypothetical protein